LSEFIEIFKSNIPNVIEEKGCIEYVPTIDMPTELPPQEMNKDVVTIIEKWDSFLQKSFDCSLYKAWSAFWDEFYKFQKKIDNF